MLVFGPKIDNDLLDKNAFFQQNLIRTYANVYHIMSKHIMYLKCTRGHHFRPNFQKIQGEVPQTPLPPIPRVGIQTTVDK